MSATLFTIDFRDTRLPGRFWDCVDRDYQTGCWLWRGYVSETGYGMFSGKKVHRIIAALIFGEQAIDGLQVLHDCVGGDNKRCCCPEHLFIGTGKENAADAIAKGQCSRVGKRGPVSRLDGRDDEILAALRTMPRTHVAAELGISETQLRRWCKSRNICPCCAQTLPEGACQ